MSISIKKVGLLAVLAAVLVTLAALRPTADTPVAHADFTGPGAIAALPSAAPAIPGVVDQGIPAIIHTGQQAIVSVFCGDQPFAWDFCDDPVVFTLTQLYPEIADPEIDRAVVEDNSGLDGDPSDGTIAVSVGAGAATMAGTQGINAVWQVEACDTYDSPGDQTCVSTQVVVVDTILAWGPTGQVSTASQEQPVFVSYACDVVGRAPLGFTQLFADWDGDGMQGLDDMYNGLYDGWFATLSSGDIDTGDDVWCGGNTGGLFDDFVDFNTDRGIFSIDPMGVDIQQASVSLAWVLDIFYPPSLDYDCGEGKNIDTFDIDAMSVWSTFIMSPLNLTLEGGCDLDGWRNGVVTTELVGNGEVGVATITAQQGGGIAQPRTINVTFTGAAALSLFITAPASVGLTGADFTVALVDQDGRPVGDETIQCTVDPTGGALALLNQTATTGSTNGQATFTLIPTGASVVAGEELTITCVMDRDRSVSASETINLSSTPELESVALVEGCNPLAATWADGTAIADVAGAVAPAEALDAIWKFDPATGTWMGYSPSAPPAVSDLASVDRLDAIFVCVNAAATISRPVI